MNRVSMTVELELDQPLFIKYITAKFIKFRNPFTPLLETGDSNYPCDNSKRVPLNVSQESRKTSPFGVMNNPLRQNQVQKEGIAIKTEVYS